MVSMDVAGVLQEAGDAYSRARTRSQVWVEINLSSCFHIHSMCSPFKCQTNIVYPTFTPLISTIHQHFEAVHTLWKGRIGMFAIL